MPPANSWPRNELGDDSALGLQADEMFARQLDAGFAGAVRSLVHDPTTGLTGRHPEDALAGIAETIPLLGDPRVGEPAAGRDYLPDNESHLNGLRGEYGLANEIARQFPEHTVIDFGRKAGQRGPDVISVGRSGEICVFDSKWRGSDTSIGPGGRAHQTTQSFEGVREHVKHSIRAAIASGHLSPEAASKALENLDNRSMTIVTVGTGSARNGVIEQIVGGVRVVVYPQRRP